MKTLSAWPTTALGILSILLMLVPSSALAAPLAQGNDPAQLVQQGDQLLLKSDFKAAEAAYTAAIAADPEYAPAYAHRCYLRTFQESKDALADCQQAIILAPNNAEGYIYLTRAYDRNLDFEKAAAAGEKATALAPQNGLAHSFLGEAYLDLGRLGEGEKELRLAIELSPNAPEAHRNLAFFYGMQGQVESQLAEFTKSMELAPGFAQYLDNIGGVYASQGQYAKALEYYEQALAIEREFGNWAGEGNALNSIGEAYVYQGQYAKALEYYQQALVIAREVDNRAREGATLNNIGWVYELQGQYAKALEYYEQALVIRKEVGDQIGECKTLNNIGGVYAYQGQYAKALEYYQQALVIAKAVSYREGEGTLLSNIGYVYYYQGQYAKALEYFEQALVITREFGDRTGEGTTVGDIGAVYNSLGQYAKALEYYQQALVIAKEVSDRAGQGTILSNIGDVYKSQGQYAKALAYLQQALVIRKEIGERAGEGTTLNNIGDVYNFQGQYDKALEYHQQALAIAREVGDRAGEGTDLNNIGTVHVYRGEYDKALEYLQQALVMAREVGNRAGEGTLLNNIGGVYKSQGQYDKALEYLQQALVIAKEIGNRAGEGTTLNNFGWVYGYQGQYTKALEYYQQALVIHKEVGNRAGEGTALDNIGRVYDSQGQSAKALEYYQQAIDVYEALRAQVGEEQSRASFISQHTSTYDKTIELLVKENQPDKAFYFAERGRARAFLDSLSTGYVELNDQESAALYLAEQQTYAARLSAQEVFAKAKAKNPLDAKLIADLETQLAQTEKDYQVALDDISERKSYLEQLIPGRSKVLDVPQAQAQLDEQTTLFSFWVLSDQTLVFVLTKNTFNIVALPISRTDLFAKIKAFRDFSNTNVAYPESAIDLYQALIQPLKAYISTPNLVIVPHGELHYLPFSALTDGKHYLMDDYSITYLPSVSTWPYIKQNAGRANANPLIIGNPTTNQTELKPLPFAESEAIAIAGLYQTTPLLGKAATESAMRSQVKQAGVLHLAAHGSYNSINSLYSAIYLAPDEQNDGLLETHEIYGLDLKQTDLVVLSACETQLGKLSTGDELVGLTRAFFFAGTPSVISSLWAVDDKTTQLLMEKFYTYWKNGMGKAEALRRAQMDVRAEYPNPYYWAGFVLSGDAGKDMTFHIPTYLYTWGIGLIFCLIISVFAIIWRRKKHSKNQKNTTNPQEQGPLRRKPDSQNVGTDVDPHSLTPSISPEKPAMNDEIQKALELSRFGKYQEAFNLLRQVIQVEPKNAQAWLFIGFTLIELEDMVSAEKCLSQAKRLGHPRAEKAIEWLKHRKQS